MSRVRITSEIGRLRAVLVHTPGNELLAVTPGTREDFLYDDIIDLDIAQREHKRFVAVLERFADVFQVTDLLQHVLERREARKYLTKEATDVVPSDLIAQRIAALPSDELVTLLVEGVEEEPGPIGQALNELGFALPPVPNLFFTRDIGIVIGDHAVIGSMRHEARWSEELLIKALFAYHPALASAGILYDGAEERRLTYTLEGGDVHPVRPDLVLLGFSSRSSPAALDHLCNLLFDCTPVTDALVVVMPNEGTAIHLDMIFTQIDREHCVVYPPHFIGPERLAVMHRRKGHNGVAEMPNLFHALRQVGVPLEPIFCGGTHRIHQDREQWASGCNLFALRPGVAIAYKRNEATLRELEKAGYPMVDGVEFLTGEGPIEDDAKAIILLEGSELVRAGGGPRCMTLPLKRDDV